MLLMNKRKGQVGGLSSPLLGLEVQPAVQNPKSYHWMSNRLHPGTNHSNMSTRSSLLPGAGDDHAPGTVVTFQCVARDRT
jgi:hypothetical protein